MFIPLGYHCNITFSSQELDIKKETGLFEWLESQQLQYITDIINTIKENIDISIVKNVGKYIYVLNQLVYTYHYNIEEYKVIFERRANRFLNTIKKSNELLFVRINPYRKFTTEDEINNFCQAIRSINPNLKMRFLLINTVDTYENCSRLNEKNIPDLELIQRYFLYKNCIEEGGKDEYLHDNDTIRNLFREYLIEIGCKLDTSDIKNYTKSSLERHKD